MHNNLLTKIPFGTVVV